MERHQLPVSRNHHRPSQPSSFPLLFTATYTAPSTGTPVSANVNQIDSSVTTQRTRRKRLSQAKGPHPTLVHLLVRRCVVQDAARKGQRKMKSVGRGSRQAHVHHVHPPEIHLCSRRTIFLQEFYRRCCNSSFSFGAIRPSSQSIADGDGAGNAAGIGSTRNMSQLRPGVGLRNHAALSFTERVSRVSFATDTRTSRVSFAW